MRRVRFHGWQRGCPQTRALAILAQPPTLSRTDTRREQILRRSAEKNVILQRRQTVDAFPSPQFTRVPRPSTVLKMYLQARDMLSPRDVAAAFYRLGQLNRASAAKIRGDPLASQSSALKLHHDVATCAPHLPSREIANALLGAAYMRCSNEATLQALCSAAAGKAATHFSQRDMASTVYSLGLLCRHDDALLSKLLPRVVSEASTFHAIEIMLTAHGLADLQMAPCSALSALSRAAISKVQQFGAEELPRLLSSLASLGHHDEQLMRLSAQQLPLLLADMTPQGISQFLAALATAKIWIPSTLQLLADETVLKLPSFDAPHVMITLAALGRLRWDHPVVVSGLTTQFLKCAVRDDSDLAASPWAARSADVHFSERCRIGDLAIVMWALARLPSAVELSVLPELVELSARLLEQMKTVRQGEGVKAAAAWMGNPQHCQDVAMLCHGMVQLQLTPPPPLVAHLHEVVAHLATRNSNSSRWDGSFGSQRGGRRLQNNLRGLAVLLAENEPSRASAERAHGRIS